MYPVLSIGRYFDSTLAVYWESFRRSSTVYGSKFQTLVQHTDADTLFSLQNMVQWCISDGDKNTTTFAIPLHRCRMFRLPVYETNALRLIFHLITSYFVQYLFIVSLNESDYVPKEELYMRCLHRLFLYCAPCLR